MTLYPLPDVAARLHKSPRWLQGYLREQPFGRMAGRTRLFYRIRHSRAHRVAAMPLKLVKRHGSDSWYIRGTVRGVAVDESTKIADKALAEAVRAKREWEIVTGQIGGNRAVATFLEAAVSYLETGGEARYVKPLINYFKTTPLAQIGQAEVETCARRLAGGCASSTVNRRIFTPMSAIMTHAAKRRLCDKPAFDRPSQPRGRVLWITFEEADMLIAGCAPHLAPLVTFMLFTGCRVGEALALDWRDVDLSRAHASFLDTKNGDRRGTPLHPRAVAALAGLTHRVGIVFRRPDKRPYAPKDDGGGQIKRAFAGACRRSGIDWLATSSVMNSNPASVGSGDCSSRDEARQCTLLLAVDPRSIEAQAVAIRANF